MEKKNNTHKFVLEILHSIYRNEITLGKHRGKNKNMVLVEVDDITLGKLTAHIGNYCNVLVHEDNRNHRKIGTVYEEAVIINEKFKKKISKKNNTPINIIVTPYSTKDPDQKATIEKFEDISTNETLVLLGITTDKTWAEWAADLVSRGHPLHATYASNIIRDVYSENTDEKTLEEALDSVMAAIPEQTEHKVKIIIVPDSHLIMYKVDKYIVPSDYESMLQVFLLHDHVKNHSAEAPFLSYDLPYSLELQIDGVDTKLEVRDDYGACDLVAVDAPLHTSRADRKMFQELLKQTYNDHAGKTLIVTCTSTSMKDVIQDVSASTGLKVDELKASIYLGMLYGLLCQFRHFVKKP